MPGERFGTSFRRRRSDGRRPHRTVITHTDEEHARVLSLAAAQGISVPRLYERALLVGDAVSAAKITRLVTEVSVVQRIASKSAVNLNQLATVANSTGEVHVPQVLAAASHLQRQVAHLEELLGRLTGGDAYDVEPAEQDQDASWYEDEDA